MTRRVVSLSDIAEIRKGLSYKGSGLNRPGLYLIGLGEFRPGGGAKLGSIRTYGGEYKERHVVRPGDLLVALTDLTQSGSVLGSPIIVPDSLGDECLFTHHVGLVALKEPDKVDRRFLYYLLRGSDFSAFAFGYATGTTVRAVRPQEAGRFEFEIPPLPEQRAIAEVLGALDDKIELNERMNATLDEMARALFKSWFVDFDPVRAKAEGRQPSHMDAATAALFPSSFEDSTLGPIPAGWQVSTVGSRVEILTGGTPKRSEPSLWDGGVPWASVADVRSGIYITKTAETISDEGILRSAAKLLPTESVVVTARGTVGEIALLAQASAINQSCYALRDRDDSQLWLYRAMEDGIGRMRLATHGSVFDTITKATFDHLTLIEPTQEIVDRFEVTVRPWHSLVLANTRESQTLAELRDALLPRLISGEIRVAAAA